MLPPSSRGLIRLGCPCNGPPMSIVHGDPVVRSARLFEAIEDRTQLQIIGNCAKIEKVSLRRISHQQILVRMGPWRAPNLFSDPEFAPLQASK